MHMGGLFYLVCVCNIVFTQVHVQVNGFTLTTVENQLDACWKIHTKLGIINIMEPMLDVKTEY